MLISDMTAPALNHSSHSFADINNEPFRHARRNLDEVRDESGKGCIPFEALEVLLESFKKCHPSVVKPYERAHAIKSKTTHRINRMLVDAPANGPQSSSATTPAPCIASAGAAYVRVPVSLLPSMVLPR